MNASPAPTGSMLAHGNGGISVSPSPSPTMAPLAPFLTATYLACPFSNRMSMTLRASDTPSSASASSAPKSTICALNIISRSIGTKSLPFQSFLRILGSKLISFSCFTARSMAACTVSRQLSPSTGVIPVRWMTSAWARYPSSSSWGRIWLAAEFFR